MTPEVLKKPREGSLLSDIPSETYAGRRGLLTWKGSNWGLRELRELRRPDYSSAT